MVAVDVTNENVLCEESENLLHDPPGLVEGILGQEPKSHFSRSIKHY